MPEPVDQILLRFPGPVTFQASRTKWFFLLLGSLSIVVVAVYWTPNRPFSSMLFSIGGHWLLIVSGCLAILISIVGILSNASKLTLNSKGFQFGLPYLPVSVAWVDAINFRAIRKGGNTILGSSFGGVKAVEFDYVAPQAKDLIPMPASIGISDHTGVLFDTYGFSNEDLARLMNGWRERALR